MSRVGAGRQACLSWMPGQNGQVPYNALQADNGLYIIRARTGPDLTIGKAAVGHQHGFFPYDGKEMSIDSYEVLCDTGVHVFGPETIWQFAANGQVPNEAVVGGHSTGNEPLYIGRGRVGADMCVGKVCASHGGCYVPHGGREHLLRQYEVLCYHG